MTQDEKFTLISKLKYQYIITDPFPEHSFYQQSLGFIKSEITLLERIFGPSKINIETPKTISIWEAYRMGQEDVYKRLEETLK